jgi:hypothetical protein
MKALDANSALGDALQENLAARGIREVAVIQESDLSLLTRDCADTSKGSYDTATSG